MSIEGRLRDSWAFRILVIIAVFAVVMVLIEVIIPILTAFEKLELYSYYWVENSQGEIRQLMVVLQNNGTAYSVVESMRFGDVLVNTTEWGGWAAGNPGGGDVGGLSSTREFYIAPSSLVFQRNKVYNLTIVTSKKRSLSFSLETDESSTRKENITITSCNFYHWPPPHFETPCIELEVTNWGGTDVIMKEITIEGAPLPIEEGTWLYKGQELLHAVLFWRSGQTYHIEIKTAVGNTYAFDATPD
jgi:hypothetical protein